MKKLASVLLIVGTLAVANIYNKVYTPTALANVQTEQKQLDDYQKQFDREAELKKKMENPTIIRNKLNKVGKIISLDGQYKFWSKITDKGLLNLTLREMTMDFTYDFGMGCDLSYITIYKIEGKTVYIHIPSNRIQLLYIQLNQDSKITDGRKMFLVSQFSPSDVEILIEQSQTEVVNKIGKDKNLFNKAKLNLQDQIEKLILGIGYYDQVIFQEV